MSMNEIDHLAVIHENFFNENSGALRGFIAMKPTTAAKAIPIHTVGLSGKGARYHE